MVSAADVATETVRIGSFNYLAASAQPSLYRNGRVFTRRDRDGSDTGWEGTDLEARPMPVHDARLLEASARRTLKSNGFELVCPMC